MIENGKIITITKDGPLVIQDQEYCKEYEKVIIEDDGYIEILVDCSFKINHLIKVGASAGDDSPNIILKGKDGEMGNPGENGEDGKNGAKGEIFIEDLESDIVVHVYGGGSGGQGGRGGDGGQGGNGAYGADGGNGGNGGDGASGGHGGHGGKLTIHYKTSNESGILAKELCAPGGMPGKAGKGGGGGNGKHQGHPGKDGREGTHGKDGRRGKFSSDKA